MGERKKPTVFVSYAHSDSEWAHAFAARLKNEGARTAIPDRSVDAGGSVLHDIQRDLRNSEYLVVILGRERAKVTPWVSFEWGAALVTDKRVLVVSPRGSNVELKEIPAYARAMSFHRKREAVETADEIKAKIDEVEGTR